MKYLVYLLSLVVLASCAGTQDVVYDDVYTRVQVEEPNSNPANDDLGYADYIRNSESQYQVEVDSSAFNNQNLNGGYYTNNGDINVYNYGSGNNMNPNGGGTFVTNNYYSPYPMTGWSNGWNNPWGYRPHCHFNNWGWNAGLYWGWGANPYWGNPWGWGGNPYWGNSWGWGGNPYWGNSYWGWNDPYWGHVYSHYPANQGSLGVIT